MPKAKPNREGGSSEGGSGKKQQGYKRSKGGCLNCKFRKVKCDEIQPSCTACQRLGMPCGKYGVTLSKAAYNEQKQSFLGQVRRKNADTATRAKRSKKVLVPTAEQTAQQEQLQMQMQLGMATLDALNPDDVANLHPSLSSHQFSQDVSHDFYPPVHQYDPVHQGVLAHETSNNLFEMNPRAASIHQQLQQLQAATGEHDELHAAVGALQDHNSTYLDDPTTYPDDTALVDVSDNKPYIPSMITMDNLMSQQQHAIRADQQRMAEEAAVRARKEETMQQQHRMQMINDPTFQ